MSDAHKAPGTTRPVYNMVDYIIFPKVCLPLVRRARSYSGTTLSSDHKLVTGELDLDILYKLYRTPNHYTPPVALGKLCDINAICLDGSNSESLSVVWQRVADNVSETTESVLRTKRGLVDPSPEIQQLSAKHSWLRIQVQSGSASEDQNPSKQCDYIFTLHPLPSQVVHKQRW